MQYFGHKGNRSRNKIKPGGYCCKNEDGNPKRYGTHKIERHINKIKLAKEKKLWH